MAKKMTKKKAKKIGAQEKAKITKSIKKGDKARAARVRKARLQVAEGVE